MAKIALKRLKRNRYGRMGIVFVDAQTGQELTSLDGYEVRDQGPDSHLGEIKSGSGLAGQQTETPKTEEKDSIAEEFIRESNSGDEGAEGADRTPTNNFGYLDKPTALGLLGLAPGMIGLAGKAVNAAINANNVAAVNAARGFLGLPSLSNMEIAKGFVSDNKGYVGDVTIGEEQYAIGLEAETASGRTTLTPNEARSRALGTGRGLGLASPDQVEAAETKHAVEFGKKSTGLLGKLTGITGSVVDAVIGKSPLSGVKSPFAPEETTTHTTTTGYSTGKHPGREITSGLGLANLAPQAKQTGPVAPGVAPNQTEYGFVDGLERFRPMRTEPKALIFHHTAPLGPNPSPEKVIEVLNRRGLGAHYVMDRKGIISQIAPDGTRVAHMKPDALGLGLDNENTIGIEVIADNDADVTPEQVAAGVAFAKAMQAKHPSIQGVYGHGELNPHKQETEGTSIAKAFNESVVAKGEGTTGSGGGAGQGFVSANEDGSQPAPEAGGSRTASNNFGHEATGQETVASGGQGRSPQEVSKIAMALAGELGAATIAGIMSGNPQAQAQARQEIAAMMSVVENRAAATGHSKGGSLDNVLTPSSFNSLSPSNMGTTRENYSIAGKFIEDAIGDFYTGDNPSPAPNATHYRSTAMANAPGWEAYAKGTPSKVGEHTFSEVAVPGTSRSEFARGLPDLGPAPTSREMAIAAMTGVAGPQAAKFASTPETMAAPLGKPSLGLFSPSAPAETTPSIDVGTAITGFDVVGPQQFADVMSTSRANQTPDPSRGYQVADALGVGVNVGTGSLGRGAAKGYMANTGIMGALSNPGVAEAYSYSPEFGVAANPGLTNAAFGKSQGQMGQTPGMFGGLGVSPGSFSGTSGTGTAGARGGFGEPGSFGDSLGGGFGHQGNAGIGMGISDTQGTMSSTTGMNNAQSSFGGFSAGSLSGSASGLGTGLGSPSAETASKGFTPGGLGNYSTPGSIALGPVDPLGTFSTTSTHSYSAGYGMGTGGIGGMSSSGSTSGGGVAAGKDASTSSAHADNPGMSGANSGGGGGDSGKVLCTYFHDIGWLPNNIYEGDLFYADIFVSDEMSKGYRKWATPLANWLREKDHPIIKRILFPFVKAWAEEMSYRVGLLNKSNILGRFMCLIGEPICTKLGKATRQ